MAKDKPAPGDETGTTEKFNPNIFEGRSQQPVKMIAAKNIGLGKGHVVSLVGAVAVGSRIAVGIFAGVVSGLIAYDDNYTGETAYKLSGNFVAVNYSEHDTLYVGPTAIIPSFIQELAVAGFNRVNEGKTRAPYVEYEIAVEIFAVNNPASAVGYDWFVKPLTPMNAAAPASLNLLSRVIGENVITLMNKQPMDNLIGNEAQENVDIPNEAA